MKKVLVFSVYNDFSALELAIDFFERGYEVYLLQCDNSYSLCQHNIKGNSLMCRHCMHSMKAVIRSLEIEKKTKLFWLSSIVSSEDREKANLFNVEFNSIQELKELNYKGAQVGYGAFSSYVTFTRNVMPELTDSFKRYISFLVKKEIMVYEALIRFHTKEQFDHIVLHNGRFAQFKPFLEFARLHSINYICTEHKLFGQKLLKDFFIDDIPHSPEYLAKNILKNWEMGDPSNREEIGRLFFERRRNGQPAGDKVFTQSQKVGVLPVDWDANKENISIFNSSEDEYCALNDSYDNLSLFPNQFTGLQTIFEHYKNDSTKHFYVRIHPNLKNVPYKSHLGLYQLKYDNVTIIPADSSVSSYTLLDNSSKVIIFYSTVGVEAAFSGKTVIDLTRYEYAPLNFLYHPMTEQELWRLIDDKDLRPKQSDNILKYGYWLLHPNYPPIEKIPYRYVHFRLFGKDFTDYTIMKVLGSYKIPVILEQLFFRMNIFSLFKELPCTEPYNNNE